ncbi:unnamed protein product [Phaeothamnion confervicola]
MAAAVRARYGALIPSKGARTLRQLLKSDRRWAGDVIRTSNELVQLKDSTAASVEDARARYEDDIGMYLQLRIRETFLDNIVRDENALAPPQFEDEIPTEAAPIAEAAAAVAAARASLREELDALQREARDVADCDRRLCEQTAALAAEVTALAPTPPALAASESMAATAGRSPPLTLDADMAERTMALRAAAATDDAAASGGGSGGGAAALAELISRRSELETQVAAARVAAELAEADASAAAAAATVAASTAEISHGASSSGLPVADAVEAAVGMLALAAEEEERAAVGHSGVRSWYVRLAETLEMLGGVHLSLAVPASATVAEEGLRATADFGTHRLEVTLRAKDAAVAAAELVRQRRHRKRRLDDGDSPSTDPDAADDGDDEDDDDQPSIEDLLALARQVLPPADLRFLVREAQHRALCHTVRRTHVRRLREWARNPSSSGGGVRGCVSWVPAQSLLTLTLPVGLTAQLWLSPDYPDVPGGVRAVSISAVSWPTNQLDQLEPLRDHINAAAPTTLDDVVTRLQAHLDGMDGGGGGGGGFGKVL